MKLFQKANTKAAVSAAETDREKEHRELSRRIAEEGIVLLKNDGTLPLTKGNIALYGSGVTKTIFGGTGSGEVNARKYVNILEGFENAGFTVTTKAWLNDYENDFKTKEAEFFAEMRQGFSKVRNGTDANNILGKSFIYPSGREITQRDVADSNTDTCVYVLSRQSGEGTDRKPEEFGILPEEAAAIEKCAHSYEKCVLVINVGSSMDLSSVEDIPDLNAIVYMCQLGEESGTALANVLSGAVCPSGHLTDTWVKSYADVPFGDTFSMLSTTPEEQNYEEGVFVGYRYYEAAGVEPRYPFGFGLSYTEFQQTVKDVNHFGTAFTVKVRVDNVGKTHGGKAVVQAYLSCPQGNFPKPKQQLVAFTKTPVLNPGESAEVSLSFDLRDETTYDEASASYILEAGNYVLRVGDSSVSTTPAAVITLPETVTIENAKPIEKHRTVNELTLNVPDPEVPEGVPTITMKSSDFRPIQHSFKDERPRWRMEADIVGQMDVNDLVNLVLGTGLHFFAFRGRHVVPGNAATTTDKLLDSLGIPQVSLADGPAGLRILRESVQYPTGQVKPLTHAISVFDYLPEKVGKLVLGNPKLGQTLYQYATAFPVGTAVAQTWNADLAEAFGAAVSTEMSEYGVTFWLAPGMNIHRNPLCGRNFEYYSEDPVLTGVIAAAVCKGVASRPGNYVTIKHFAANNQEFMRNKASSNLSERALREVYLRPFKRAIRDGGAKAVMTSYNPVNGIYNVENKSLLEDYLRGECGFDGIVMTDWTSTAPGLANPVKAIEAGNDLLMPGLITDRIALLKAVKTEEMNLWSLQHCAERIVKVLLESEQGQAQRKVWKQH